MGPLSYKQLSRTVPCRDPPETLEFSKLAPPLSSDVFWGRDSWAREHLCYVSFLPRQQYPPTLEQHR